jgi:hypothetical protein
MAGYPCRVTIELALLTRVAYRGQEITGPRPRGLLALLAGDLRRGCSTARLVEGLWPEELPEHPAEALQVVVSRARAQLGADVIASTPAGYRLSLADEQVDASAVLLSAAAAALVATTSAACRRPGSERFQAPVDTGDDWDAGLDACSGHAVDVDLSGHRVRSNHASSTRMDGLSWCHAQLDGRLTLRGRRGVGGGRVLLPGAPRG